jgi:hypothetical protein
MNKIFIRRQQKRERYRNAAASSSQSPAGGGIFLGVIKRKLGIVLKVLGAAAFVIAFFAPLHTFNQLLIFVGSVSLGAAFVIVSRELDAVKGGLSLWPPKPDK